MRDVQDYYPMAKQNGISGLEWETLTKLGVPTELKQGEFFHKDSIGTQLYLVLEGRVQFYIMTKTGNKQIFVDALSFDTFGEVAVFTDGKRTATANVLEQGVALAYKKADLPTLRAKCPVFNSILDKRLGACLKRNVEVFEHSALIPDKSELDFALDKLAKLISSPIFLLIHVAVFATWIWYGWHKQAPTYLGALAVVMAIEGFIISQSLLYGQIRKGGMREILVEIQDNSRTEVVKSIDELNASVNKIAEVEKRLESMENHLENVALQLQQPLTQPPKAIEAAKNKSSTP